MAEQTVTLQPSESKVVTFEAIPSVAKTYQVSVDGLSGSFRTVAPRTNLSLSCSPVEPEYKLGNPAGTYLYIKNTGSVLATGVSEHLIVYDSNGAIWRDHGWHRMLDIPPGETERHTLSTLLADTDPLGQYTYKAWARADNADEISDTGNTFVAIIPD